jgi:hypothetical protein
MIDPHPCQFEPRQATPSETWKIDEMFSPCNSLILLDDIFRVLRTGQNVADVAQ